MSLFVSIIVRVEGVIIILQKWHHHHRSPVAETKIKILAIFLLLVPCLAEPSRVDKQIFSIFCNFLYKIEEFYETYRCR